MSSFKLYSYGLVADDSVRDKNMINVYPIELLPTETGELRENEKLQSSTTLVDGGYVKSQVQKSKLITAKWLGGGSNNRITAPRVCKGERVMLYQNSGNDQFFWDILDYDVRKRKLENITYVVNGTPNIGNSDLNNTYYLTIDTEKSFVHFHTSTANNEKTTYDLYINTKEGEAAIVDGNNNEIKLESVEGNLKITLNKDMIIKLGNDRNVDITANDTLKIGGNQNNNISGNLDEGVNGNRTSNIKGNETLTAASISITSQSKVEVKAQQIECTATTATVTAPSISLLGNTSVAGSFSAAPGGGGGGGGGGGISLTGGNGSELVSTIIEGFQGVIDGILIDSHESSKVNAQYPGVNAAISKLAGIKG